MSHDAFLRAILDRPDDDLPRLVYADYLDDVGDHSRAEFIRVQCELAHLPEDDPRRPALEDREHELLSEHESTWLGVETTDLPEWRFHRGFIDDITACCWTVPDRLFATHPVVRWSLVADEFADYDDPAWLLQVSHLRGIRELDLSGWRLRIGDYEPLLASDHTPALTALDFSHVPGIGQLAEVLASAPVTRKLRSLAFGGRSGRGFVWGDAANETLDVARFNHALSGTDLEHLAAFDCGLESPGLRWLLAAPWAAHLKTLDVSGNPIAPDAWRAFRHAPHGTRLTRLDVSGTPLAGISLEPLLASPPLETLTELDMSRCGSARKNMEVLADSEFWTRATELRVRDGTIPAATLEPLCLAAGPPGLTTLDLGHNFLRAEGVRMLCDAPWSGSLTWLSLTRNYLDDAAVYALAGSDRFTRLRTLHLAGNQIDEENEDLACITDAGAEALAAAPSLARLRTLTISHTAVTDRGAVAVLEGLHWRLARLGLAGCDLSPAFAEALARSPRLARLEWLDLSSNPRLSGAALRPLAESPDLSRLCELDVRHVYLDDRVRAALRQRLGPRLSE